MARQQLRDLDFNNIARVTNLLNPTAAQDAATKSYVDSAVEGLAWKDSARVSTQGNLNLAAPGATIDGVAMAVSDRVLVRSQSTGSQNGIYIWNGAAVAATRAPDANTAAELEQAVITVEEGTDAGATFRQTVVNFTLDSSTVTFTAFGTGAPAASETTAGIAELATQAETNTGTDDLRIVTSLKLANHSNRKLKFAANFGDGSATSYAITHNLGTLDVQVAVFRNSGVGDEVGCDIEHTNANTVTLIFNAAPTSNQFRIVVLG